MNAPIAIFDSGIGGLTVLQKIAQLLPNENYIYLADNAFFPYGIKPFDLLDLRLQCIVKYLMVYNPKVIVVACNTASLHVESMRILTNIPIVEVISPTCKWVSQASKNKKVCLLATDATVSAGAYQNCLRSLGFDVVAVGCSIFVPLAEGGCCNTERVQQIVDEKLSVIAPKDFDTVILGCTHFGLLKREICNVLGERIYVECGYSTALQLQKILAENEAFSCNRNGSVRLLTTGDSSTFDAFKGSFALPLLKPQVVRI